MNILNKINFVTLNSIIKYIDAKFEVKMIFKIYVLNNELKCFSRKINTLFRIVKILFATAI